MNKGANKLGKYMFMKGSAKLVHHLPETRKMTKSNFENLLRKYGSVIVKPDNGGGGANVYKVTALGKENYVIHKESKRTTLKGIQGAHSHLRNRMGSRTYIVQRRVDLATVNNRPFDMRVIVQRKRNQTEWKVTGELVKVAGKGYIVTNNTRSKGKLLPIRTGIRRSSITKRPLETVMSDVHRVATLAGKRLNAYYPRQRIFGLDMGLDKKGHVWIIEANLQPSMSHFLKMKNFVMYNRIMKIKSS